MARPFTRAQQRQNASFLRALEAGGNIRLAARECGLDHTTMRSRRTRNAAFAQRWDAALATAQARLHASPERKMTARGPAGALRTSGGEAVTVLLANGRAQVRRARAGRVTQHALQAFLLALSATANLTLAAHSVGIAPSAIFRRRRRDPAFAREVLAALALGYERVERALIESFLPTDAAATEWRDNEPPALPPMTSEQAVQMLYLRHKRVRWRETEWQRALLPGETRDARSARLARLYRAKLLTDAAEVLDARLAPEPPGADEPPPIVLPDLAQVTGWSRADAAKGGHGPAALFGGWRIKDMEAQSAAARDAAQAEAAQAEADARAERERGWAAAAARAEGKKRKRKRRC